jgi:hypothetical protein
MVQLAKRNLQDYAQPLRSIDESLGSAICKLQTGNWELGRDALARRLDFCPPELSIPHSIL